VLRSRSASFSSSQKVANLWKVGSRSFGSRGGAGGRQTPGSTARSYRRVEERRARLGARIEREHLLDEVLPRRFSLARCALTRVAVALVVPQGATP
jgi:hypothetical protein